MSFSPIVPKKPEFRVSSLPFCGLLYIEAHTQLEEQKQQYSSEFYFSLGSALHSLYQRFAAIQSPTELIGDWKCNRIVSRKEGKFSDSVEFCKKQYYFCSLKQAKKRHECPHKVKCKPSFTYEELTLKYKGLTGHVDLLYLIDGRYILADIKTTSDFLFDKTNVALKTNYYPSKKYFHQLATYALLLEKIYKIKIHSYAIVYISRSAPTADGKIKHYVFARRFKDKEREQRNELLKNQIQQAALANTFLEEPDKTVLKKLWNIRPCQATGDYDKLMSAKFYKDKCPHLDNGVCQSGKLVMLLMKDFIG